MKNAFITDSGTGIFSEEFLKEGIISLPLQITDTDVSYNDMVDINKEKCIDLLKKEHILKTSQPITGIIYDTFMKLKDDGVENVYAVPICSGLSGTLGSIQSVCRELELNLIYFDTHVTAMVQDYLIKFIKKQVENNVELNDLTNDVNSVIDSTNTFLIPTDLKHFKRGGRLTPLAYGIAEILKIVPILVINKKTNGKIDSFAKVRSFNSAFDKVLNTMKTEINSPKFKIIVSHVDSLEKANKCKKIIEENFPENEVSVLELCNVVAAHSGLDCIAIQYFKAV